MEGDNASRRLVFHLIHFNPLPPHGGRRCDMITKLQAFYISIQSLRMEGDGLEKDRAPLYRHFNPLPPHGGRPAHVPQLYPAAHFNPLPPHGGRLTDEEIRHTHVQFQSTPSAWRETTNGGGVVYQLLIFQSTPSAWRETSSPPSLLLL